VEEAKKAGKNIEGMILNKSEDILEEFSVEEAENFVGSNVLMRIPHHKEVKKSIHRKEPIVVDEHSEIGDYFKKLASELTGREYRSKWYSPVVRFARKIGIGNV
jgi:nitrogenase subunit NifH